MRPAPLRWTVLIAIATLAAVPTRATQSAAPATMIQGRTVNALTGEPVRGALVQANFGRRSASTSGPDLEFLSGLDGRFVLNDLSPGTYGLVGTKTGYVPATSDQVPTAPRDSKTSVEIALVPEAVISGMVLDQNGEPGPTSTVQVVPRGQRISFDNGMSVTTDNAGRYSVGGLPAGEYVVGVRPQAVSSVQMFYPAAFKPDDATPITVRAGEERPSIDFKLPISMPPPRFPGPAATAGTGTIAGVVRDSNGRGLSQALVTIGSIEFDSSGNARASMTRASLSDANGQFRFEGLRGGRFRIFASRSASHVQTGDVPYGMTVELSPGQSILDLSVTLVKLVTLTGTVRDQYGDPLSASVVVSPVSGDGLIGLRRAATDSRGRYAIVGLRPGEYFVAVDKESTGRNLRMFDDAGVERTVAYKLTYYPGVADSSLAAAVTIADRDISDLDLVLRPVPATTINVIVDPMDRAVGYAQVQAIAIETLGGKRMRSAAPTDLSPVALQGIAAGQYLLVASGDAANADGRSQRFWARQEIRTDGLASQTVRLALEAGVNLSGRIVFEGVSTPPQAVTVSLRTMPPYDLQTAFAVQSSHTRAGSVFAIEDVMPGRYQLDGAGRADAQSPWTLKSVLVGGRDVFDLPLDLAAGSSVDDVVMTFTDRASGTEVTGTVTDAAGRPVADASVVVFSSDDRYWRDDSHHVRTGISDPQGGFSIAGLPAGTYRIANLPRYQYGNVTPMLGKLVPDAVSFTLVDGEHKVIDLRRAR